MPYCKNCGFKVPEDAAYCPNCGTPISKEIYKPRLELASWGERIAAYLIDTIIIGVVIIPLALTFLWPWSFFLDINVWRWNWAPFVSFGLNNIVSFVYWALTEGLYGQSIGKRALKIKVTKVDGSSIDFTSAVIESLGKAFLLPIDFILGLILYPQKQQRLFNYISNTIVIKVQ